MPRFAQLIRVACATLLCAIPGLPENRGQADFGSQGYYLGGNSSQASRISGLFLTFRNFIPNFGLVSGSLEGYGRQGRFQSGDNYLDVRGLSWGGERWAFTGGDFRVSSNLVDFPFTNIFYPEIAVKGIRADMSSKDRQVTVFWGGETLVDGPRVSFRISVPQSLLGISVKQTFGKRLQLGARFLRFSSNANAIEENPFFFPAGREFRTVNTFAIHSLYSISKNLKIYGEATASASERAEDGGKRGLSVFAGPVWESAKFSVRANYSHLSTSYLPALGYFLGDRSGPFAEIKFRPFGHFEVFSSASRYTNNLERDPELPTFRSTAISLGTSFALPWKFTVNSQLSSIGFSVRAPESDVPRESDNRQLTFSAGRPVGRHNLRLSIRDLRLLSNLRVERQRSAEIEDLFKYKRFVLGGAVRGQGLKAEQRRNTVFARGSVQGNFGRFSTYAYIERGADLVNRTVFATNTFNTSVFGLAARLTKGWNLQAEMFRNRLLTELNPENIFVLETRGIGVSPFLTNSNQWSVFFRLTKQIHWGGPLPAEGLDRYTAEQIPLIGAVEGFVREQLLDGTRPAEGIPIILDHSRTGTTDAEGRFLFSDVPEGPHKVTLATAELPSDYDPGPIVSTDLTVRPRRTSRADLNVVRLTHIQGNVVGPDGVPLDNILIRLLPVGRYTTPDSEGNFYFHNLREGDYEVVIEERGLPEDSVLVGPGRIPASVRHKSETAPVRFEFKIQKREKPVHKRNETMQPPPAPVVIPNF